MGASAWIEVALFLSWINGMKNNVRMEFPSEEEGMEIREVSEAQRNAVRKRDKEKVDKVTVRLPKGTKEMIIGSGYSVNEYVIKAVTEQLRRDVIEVIIAETQ